MPGDSVAITEADHVMLQFVKLQIAEQRAILNALEEIIDRAYAADTEDELLSLVNELRALDASRGYVETVH